MFSLSRKACLLYKTSKIVFCQSILTIYYMRIRGLTGGYKGLHEVTRADRGLQGVTGDYKWLQGVTKDYKNFFLNENFPRYFFLVYLHKN